MRICPICKKEYMEPPALSRRDSVTEICSVCATEEALEDAGLGKESSIRSAVLEMVGRNRNLPQQAVMKSTLNIDNKGTDMIMIRGKRYSKKKLCLDWFKMSNDAFFVSYGFNFNPHDYPGLYEWGRKKLFGGQ